MDSHKFDLLFVNNRNSCKEFRKVIMLGCILKSCNCGNEIGFYDRFYCIWKSQVN